MRKFNPFKPVTLALGCAALVMATIAVAADFGRSGRHQSRMVSIDGSFGTSGDLVPTATPGVFHNSIRGVGNVPRLGVCEVIIEETVDFRTDPPSGTQDWVLTFAGGDQMTATLHGTGNFDQTDPAFIRGALQGTLAGRSGRFEQAAGAVRGSFAAHIYTTPGVFPAAGHGTITLEGFLRLDRHGD